MTPWDWRTLELDLEIDVCNNLNSLSNEVVTEMGVIYHIEDLHINSCLTLTYQTSNYYLKQTSQFPHNWDSSLTFKSIDSDRDNERNKV